MLQPRFVCEQEKLSIHLVKDGRKAGLKATAFKKMLSLPTDAEIEACDEAMQASIREWAVTNADSDSVRPYAFLSDLELHQDQDWSSLVPEDSGNHGMGVGAYGSYSAEKLDAALGWIDGHPLLFSPPKPEPEPKKLHRAQQAGVAAMLHRANLKDADVGGLKAPGVLLADGVGIGKTSEALAYLATVASYVTWDSKKPALLGGE